MHPYSILAMASILASTAATGAVADNAGPGHGRSIIVTGVGDVTRAPDMALLSLGVETEGATAAEALRQNSAQMEATLKTLKDAGVDKKDIQTAGISISAKYDYSRENAPPRLVGYQAANTISVKLRNLDKAGGVIDKAVSGGANRLDQVSFGFADPEPLLDEARKAAVADARDRAALYAGAAGVKLGPVLRISDSFVETPGPVMAMARMEAAGAGNVPIAAGESVVSASVTIIFAIE